MKTNHYLILCIILCGQGIFSSDAHAECRKPFGMSVKGQESCWDNDSLSENSMSYIVASNYTLGRLLENLTAKGFSLEDVEYVAVLALQKHTEDFPSHLAAFSLHSPHSTNFEPNDCNIHSVGQDVSDMPSGILTSHWFIREPKTCYSVKRTIAEMLINEIIGRKYARIFEESGYSKAAESFNRQASTTPYLFTGYGHSLLWQTYEWRNYIEETVSKGWNVNSSSDFQDIEVSLVNIGISASNGPIYFYDPLGTKPIGIITSVNHASALNQLSGWEKASNLMGWSEAGFASKFTDPQEFASYAVNAVAAGKMIAMQIASDEFDGTTKVLANGSPAFEYFGQYSENAEIKLSESLLESITRESSELLLFNSLYPPRN